MAVQFNVGQLQINSRFIFLSVFHCNIHSKYGEHTRAEIIGTVKSGEAINALLNISEDKLEIIGRNDNSTENIIFSGIIECVEIKHEGQYASIIVRAVSCEWKMDIEKKSRSFQDLTMTYKDVVERVCVENGVAMSWNLPDRQIEHPLIQYRETDYCFLKRILSHLGGNIYVADTQTNGSFSAGLGVGSSLGEIDLSGRIYSDVLFNHKKTFGYKIENMNYVRVGDVLSIQGRTYYVMELYAVIKHNTLNCTCLVFPQKCFETERIPADNLRGTVIVGKVLNAEREMVKLHLEIDKEQKLETAYNFPWKPITGNLLYGMPDKGSKVALYFGEGEEKKASAIYSIRENGDECKEIADCNNRYFTTLHEKRMYLKPSEAGLVNLSDKNAQISLNDDSCLHVQCSHKISIKAEEQIILKGKKIKIAAPKEATLAKRDIMSPTVVNLCNAFDAIGVTGDFAAVPKTVKTKRNKIVYGQPMERYSLDGVTEAVLSNIPADEMGSSLMEALAGSMPIISRNFK